MFVNRFLKKIFLIFFEKILDFFSIVWYYNYIKREENTKMKELTNAYNNYIKALADSSVSVDELQALYDKWVEIKLEVEGRD